MIWFCTRVGQVEISADLADHDSLQENLIMNEVDGYCDIFDARCDCLGLEDADAGLDIFIDW